MKHAIFSKGELSAHVKIIDFYYGEGEELCSNLYNCLTKINVIHVNCGYNVAEDSKINEVFSLLIKYLIKVNAGHGRRFPLIFLSFK